MVNNSQTVMEILSVLVQNWAVQLSEVLVFLLNNSIKIIDDHLSVTDEQHVCRVALQTVATATAGPASVMKAGLEMPASSGKSVTYPTRRAKSCAKTHRGWCAPTEVVLSLTHTRARTRSRPHTHLNLTVLLTIVAYLTLSA